MALASPLREVHDPATFTALVHAPPHASPLPLLLFLHGAGESGARVRALLSEGASGTPPSLLERREAPLLLSRRFVTVAPQTDHGWRPAEVHAFLDFLLAPGAHGLAIDPKRCYVTGHSMGGGGAIAAAAWARRFAAVVPVAPAGVVAARQLLGVPMWAFHGKNDVVVPSFPTEQLVSDLRALGAKEDEARLTLYEKAPAPVGWPDYEGHASTIPAYSTPELYKWLLEQHLP